MSLIFYTIDTETTGLSASFHEINQISIIRNSDAFQKTFNIKVDFPHRASKEALEIQGKTVHDLKKGIDKLEAVIEFEEFIEEDQKTSEHRCLVAHNASFDRRFMHALWTSVNRKLPVDLWLCTRQFSAKYAKKQGIIKPSLKLNAACEMVGVTPKIGAHNAVVDTINAYELCKTLMDKQLGHVPLIKRVPHEPE